MTVQEISAEHLQQFDTPTMDGAPAEGTMWRKEVLIERRHYRCPTPAHWADLNWIESWPELVPCSVDGVGHYWVCVGCSALWTSDRHWAEPDCRVNTLAAASEPEQQADQDPTGR